MNIKSEILIEFENLGEIVHKEKISTLWNKDLLITVVHFYV